MQRYMNKRVVVTGGTSGIGAATARLLLEEGARVLVTGSSSGSVAAAQSSIGPSVVSLRSEVSTIEAIEELAVAVRSTFSAIDALIVCAGQTAFEPFEQANEATFDKLFSVNAKGTYFTVQKLVPLIQEGGSVVLTTSVVNVLGRPMVSAYAATKAAVRSMTRSMARELLTHRIRVNAVSPGPIDSGILEKTVSADQAETARRQMTEGNPMKRFGRPEEVAKAIAFLAFEATYTTGAEFTVDGGSSQI